MLVLPTATTLIFGIPLKPPVVSAIGLFLLPVLFTWMFGSTCLLLFIFPLGIWLIQPGVNELYRNLEKAAQTADET